MVELRELEYNLVHQIIVKPTKRYISKITCIIKITLYYLQTNILKLKY